MDLGTILGILIGCICIVVSIVMGGGSGFINYPSFLITFGGTIAATLIHYPLPKIMATFGVVRKAFTSNENDYKMLFQQLTTFAIKARREGMLSLEQEIEMISDPFIKKGFQLAVDGTPVETIRSVLEEDIRSMRERHSTGQGIFRAIALYAPAFGMIGTLIGLIQMLRQMENPSLLGKGMAVALVTTLYGALIAYLFAMPIAGKLEQRSQEELSLRLMAMEGIIAIQQGSTLKVVQEKLTSYMPPSLRKEIASNQ